MKKTGMLLPTTSMVVSATIDEHGWRLHTEVSFISVEPNSKPVDITSSVSGATTTCYGGEPDEDWRFLVCAVQE
jgi:hypothetical protein